MKKLLKKVLASEYCAKPGITARARCATHMAKSVRGHYVFVLLFHHTNSVMVISVLSNGTKFNRCIYDHYSLADRDFINRLIA